MQIIARRSSKVHVKKKQDMQFRSCTSRTNTTCNYSCKGSNVHVKKKHDMQLRNCMWPFLLRFGEWGERSFWDSCRERGGIWPVSLNFALASFCRVHVGSLIRSSMRRSANMFTHRQTEVDGCICGHVHGMSMCMSHAHVSCSCLMLMSHAHVSCLMHKIVLLFALCCCARS